MSSPSFYTSAGNFIDAVQGGVDPRTGLFTVNLPLMNLRTCDLAGPGPMGAKLENATYLTTHCYNLILVIFSFSYLIVRKWCTNEMTHPKVILLSFGRYYCGCPITTGCGQGKMSQIAAWLPLGQYGLDVTLTEEI